MCKYSVPTHPGQVIMTSPLRARFPCSFGINDGYGTICSCLASLVSVSCLSLCPCPCSVSGSPPWSPCYLSSCLQST